MSNLTHTGSAEHTETALKTPRIPTPAQLLEVLLDHEVMRNALELIALGHTAEADPKSFAKDALRGSALHFTSALMKVKNSAESERRERIHRLCAWLKISEDKPCNRCEPHVNTAEGCGILGCFALAEEAYRIAHGELNPKCLQPK